MFKARAFTLIELLVVIAIVGIVASMILPALGSDVRLHLLAATDLMTSDIEFAQAMSVGDPANPLVVRFDPANATYWIATAADPATPIIRSDTQAEYLVTFGAGRGAPAEGVGFGLSNIVNDTLSFDVFGAVVGDGSNPVIRLSHSGESIDIIVTATTGSVRYADVP